MNQGCDAGDNGEPKEARYANYFKVGHNALEFVLDFGQLYPENTKTAFHTRIVTGPVYAKALLKTLQKAINQFETTHGVILNEEGPQRK